MKRTGIIAFLLLMGSASGHAQFRFGGEFGFYYGKYFGVNVLDSITVNGISSNQGELFFTVFVEQTIKKNLELHSKLSLKPVYPTFVVYNSDVACQFCPVKKVSVVGVTTLSLEMLPQISFSLTKTLKTKLFFGTSINLNFNKEASNADFSGKHEGLSDVINSLPNALKPVDMAMVCGGSLEFKNVLTGVRMQLRSPYSREITVHGDTQDFKNNWQFVTFSLGYVFQSKKNKLKFSD